MSTILGSNMKWTASSAVQSGMRAFFEEGLGAQRVKELPEMDVFSLGNAKGTIGVAYVEASKALSVEQAAVAPWVEFLVADVPAAVERMSKLGLEKLEYHDKEHSYFRAPSGVVFRLAAAS
jgi:hypothetical protein